MITISAIDVAAKDQREILAAIHSDGFLKFRKIISAKSDALAAEAGALMVSATQRHEIDNKIDESKFLRRMVTYLDGVAEGRIAIQSVKILTTDP